MIAIAGVIVIPAAAAALLAAIADYRRSSRINIIASFIAFACALLLIWHRPEANRYLLVDDLNIVFIVLGTFVGLTTSVFSASYIGHELASGRLTPDYLRFYHAMYQLMLFGMNLALAANKHRSDVGSGRAGHADDGDDGRNLPHARSK